jgi:septal ring factor EnvC (AmiA/AmiB activator)
MAEALFQQLKSINNQLGKIMAAVQLDDSELNTVVQDVESLVTASNSLADAVSTFLNSPAAAQVPVADLAAVTTALADAGTAQAKAANTLTTLQNATPVTPPAGS